MKRRTNKKVDEAEENYMAHLYIKLLSYEGVSRKLNRDNSLVWRHINNPKYQSTAKILTDSEITFEKKDSKEVKIPKAETQEKHEQIKLEYKTANSLKHLEEGLYHLLSFRDDFEKEMGVVLNRLEELEKRFNETHGEI